MDIKSKVIVFMAALLSLLSMDVNAGSIIETAGSVGSIRDRVVNEENEILPGAIVYIEELHTGVTSDANGFYNFSNIKPGTYNVSIRYIGYSPTKAKITITSDKAIEKVFKLSEGQLQEVNVNGAFQGQRRALSMQQNAMGVSNVVSADQVGKFPDSNIGDALKRINGVNVQYDQGEARFGQVRGTNAISGKMNKNFGVTFGRRFFDNKLGVMAAASYQYNPVGSDNTEFKYDVDKKGNVFLDKAEMRQYYVTRERQSYSLALDYKFNVNHKIGFKGIYNRRSDWENRYRITSKKISSDPTKQSLVLQTKAGDSSNKDARLELQQMMDFTLDGEHHFGNLKFDWAGSYSRATEDRPEERFLDELGTTAALDRYYDNVNYLDLNASYTWARN